MTNISNSESRAPVPSLKSTYVHLRDDRTVSLVPLTDTFWQEVMSEKRPELDQGRLVLQFEFSEDWSTWEMHPVGEELVVLLFGRAELVLEQPGGEQTSQLNKPGDFVLVPHGTWHTARVKEPCSMLFITPGEGTQHRPC